MMMNKLLLILLLIAAMGCKKDISSEAHLYPVGALVQFYDITVPGAVPPMVVTGIYRPAEKRDPNFYTVIDANNHPWVNVADYQLKPYNK